MGNIMEELIKGREWTSQLQNLMKITCNDDVSFSQKRELVGKLILSLSDAIFVLRNECSGEVCQISKISGDRRTMDSGQSTKRPALKDQRGDNKRRKSNSDSRIKIASSINDEHAWRKYGQKETRDSTFPRCYFRCTHKHDQGCKATKQVQRVQDEPIKYQITYFGHHTCRKILQPELDNIIFDSCSIESNLINFQSYTPVDRYPSPSWPKSVKEEHKDVQSDLTLEELSPSDSITWPDPTLLMKSDINEVLIPDVYSYASPVDSHGMYMNFFSGGEEIANCFESIFEVV